MFIVITGSTGVGKSTVAERIAKTMEPACHVDLDTIKHFVVTGFKYDKSGTGLEQWKLLGRNAAQVIRNFLDSGYSVVVNGMVNEETWDEIFKINQPDLKVLLMASREINIDRDAGRTEQAQMGEDSVHEHQSYFDAAQKAYFKDFKVIDTSRHTVDESVSDVLSLSK